MALRLSAASTGFVSWYERIPKIPVMIHPLPRSHSASSTPERVAVGLAGVGREQVPGDDRVDGGVAHAAGAPVDHRAQTAVPREQVEVGEVAVEPRRWPVMVGGGDGPFPDCGERLLVEAVIELGDARSYRLVAQPDRTAAVVPRPVGGVDGSQGPHEVSQVERGLHGVVELVERRHGAGEPLHDAPRVGERLVRLAQRDGHRHGQRELRGDDGQPGLLLGHGVHRPVDAREANGEVVAEPVQRVVRPRRRHPLDGKVRPLGVLARQ